MVALAEDGDLGSNSLIKCDGTNTVLLTQHPVRQGGGDRAPIFVLGHRTAAVPHAVGDIGHQQAAEVGIFFELLDVETVLPRPDFPINMPKIVAVDVFSVLPEFHRLPEIGTAVQAG